MNIMSLDAAYGHGTIQDMMISGGDDSSSTAETVAAASLPTTAPPKVNTKIKPMELLPDAELNIPASIHHQQEQQQQGFSSFLPPPPPPPPPPSPSRLPPPPMQQQQQPLPHPGQFLHAVAPDERLEAELQQNIAKQQAAQPLPPTTSATPLRGGNARFAKYDGNGNGGVVVIDGGSSGGGSGGITVKPSLATNVTSFYQRNKVGILIVVILFFLFIGVLIAVVVKSSSTSKLPPPTPPRQRQHASSVASRSDFVGGGVGARSRSSRLPPFSILEDARSGAGGSFIEGLDWRESASQTGR